MAVLDFVCKIVDSRSGGVAIRGALLREYLHNVSFSPAASTDVISFDSNGDQQGGYRRDKPQTSFRWQI